MAGCQANHLPIGEDGVRFDFDEHLRRDEPNNLHHGTRGANGGEEFAVSEAGQLPLANIGEKDTSANHILQLRACLVQSSLNIPQDLNALDVEIAQANNLSMLIEGGSPRDVDIGPDAYGSRIADHRFPARATGKILAIHRTPSRESD